MLRIAMIMACLSVGQVRAEMFDTSSLSASDFDTLGSLASKWESRAEEARKIVNNPRAKSEDSNRSIGVNDAYSQAAGELRGALETIQAKKENFEVAQVTGQDFGQRPPVPVGPDLEKKYPTPLQHPVPPPSYPQPTQKQVQACSVQFQAPAYNYSSGGRWRIFGRRANGGGFRLFGRRGGC